MAGRSLKFDFEVNSEGARARKEFEVKSEGARARIKFDYQVDSEGARARKELYLEVNTKGARARKEIDFQVNSEGARARKGYTGKYYCGRLVLSCRCCDGRCGPNNGCNCRPCQQLDMGYAHMNSTQDFDVNESMQRLTIDPQPREFDFQVNSEGPRDRKDTITMSDSRKEKVFHHTTKPNAVKILEERKIKKSDASANRDAVHGSGTYVTKLGPQHSPDKVAKNNWDGATNHWEKHRDDGRTDVIFEMNLPKGELEKCKTGKRSVLKTSGDIELKPGTKVHVRDEDNPKKYTTYTI